MNVFSKLIASTIMTAAVAFATPASAQDGRTPAFRVPLGQGASTGSNPPVYAWMQSVGACSTSCGTGTRTTTYQCQDASTYDFSGGTGYGAPEASSFCTAISPKPADTTGSCTNYSGCSYTWVKPAVVTTRLVKAGSVGGVAGNADDCSYAHRVFSPYCQRAGSPAVTMPAQDYAFCKNDLPNYSDVANNVADAKGYDRTTDVTTGCTSGPRDNVWVSGAWGAASSTCSIAPTHSRTVTCKRIFDGTGMPDTSCTGMTKPATTEVLPIDVSGCFYSWSTGAYGSPSSTCSDAATSTRSVVCSRSDGATAPDSFCLFNGPKPASSSTAANYTGCTYAWGTPSAWSTPAACSATAPQTRTVSCMRSNGSAVADSYCDAPSKPATSNTVSNYDSCTYAARNQGATTCSAGGTQTQYWDCTRSDGTTGFPASYCGKTSPVAQSCTPSKSPYTAVDHGYGACNASGQRPHYWDCTGFDGSTGNPASNCGHSNPEMETCTFTAVSGGTSACSAGGTQTTSWSCRGNQDGATYPATYCGHQAVETTGCTPPVTYRSSIASVDACQPGNTQTTHYACTGSDGRAYPNAYCSTADTGTQGCTYVNPVSYSWQSGAYGAYNSTCSASATQTRSVYCGGSDGNVYPDANCSGAKPATSNTQAVYSGCTYRSTQTATSSCNGTTKTVSYQCTRSDGVAVANSNCGTPDNGTQSCTITMNSCSNAYPNIYSCTGSEIGRYETSQGDGNYGNAAYNYNHGDSGYYNSSYCAQKGGTCWYHNTQQSNEYGSNNLNQDQYVCAHGSAYVSGTFANDSFQQDYSEYCNGS